MNLRYTASLRNQNGFAWVAGLMLVGAIALVGVFAQTAGATKPDKVDTEKINICHKTEDSWMYMDTPAGASLDGHLGHGDFLYGGPTDATDEVKDQWCLEHEPESNDGPQCESTELVIVSDDETSFINDGTYPAVEVTPHSAWDDYDTLPAGASWIWNAEKVPADDSGSHPAGTVTFTRNFEITGTPTGAVLEITADNEYEVSINGNIIGDDDNWQTVESYLIDASDLQEGTNNITIVAVNGAGESGNPAGLIFRLEVDSEVCPDTEVTLHAQKIVCDDEEDLPNWGDHDPVTSIDEDTATEWMNEVGANLGCEFVDWDFQWGYATQTGDPDDSLADAGAGWNTFSGSTVIDIANENDLRVRESADADYIGFTGQNTDQDISAEVYCGTDVLHYDNWEWMNDVVAGEDYYCVAWNVPLEKPEPNFCPDNLLVNGGFEEDVVTDPALWQLFASIPGWLVDWTDGNDNDTPMFELQAGVLGWLPSEGDQYIELDSDRPDTQANTKIWQDIPTDDDTTYSLSYQFSPRPNTSSADNTVEVYWNGNLVDTVGADNFTGNTVWTLEGATGLEGVNGLSNLEFRSVGTSNEYGAFVDEVCLVEVPEEACTLNIYSDTENNFVLGDPDATAVATYDGHEAWTANIPGATWIWSDSQVQEPVDGETQTIVQHFWWGGNAGDDASLTIATDNSSEVWLNGTSVVVMPNENNFGLETTYDVSSAIVPGVNELRIEVENWPLENGTYESNPAGALYKLSVIGSGRECAPQDLPECSDNIDNDDNGQIDYVGGDLGCTDPLDDEEEFKGPDYGPYCGDGIVGNPQQDNFKDDIDQSWEQCDLGNENGNPESPCNQYCQFADENQCTDLVVARINTVNIVNTPEDVSNADMTSDVWIGGDEEGVNNIPGGTWFPVYFNGNAIDDADFGAYDNYEDVPGYAVNRDEDMVRVRMHGDHGNEFIREHAEGNIEIRHAYTSNSVLTAMTSQLAQNKLEFPFNGTTGSVTNPGNDELNLGGLGNFWMVVGPDDDGFRAEYSTENLPACEGDVTICKENGYGTALNGWQVMLLGDLVDEVAVNPDGNDYTSDNLPADDYVILANGEYVYRGTAGAENSDAAYSERDPGDSVYGGPFIPWVRENDFPVPNQGWLGIIMNNSFTDWGNIFNPAHQYALGVTTSGVQSFKILDDQYGDNSGSIDMDIYEGWVGITGGGQEEEAGCYTFHDVPVGEYTVAEIMQDGWSHDSETEDDLGPVIVDGDELFTIVNDEDDKECDPKFDDCDGEGDEEHIIVRKEVTEGSATDGSFEFDPSWDENFFVAVDSEHDSGDLEPGWFAVSEVVPSGWALGNVSCYSSEDQVESLVALDINPSEFYLSEGETITCVFTNDQDDQTPETPGGNNNTSHSNSRRSSGGSNGRVLGASTEGFCPFLKDYLHINMQNNPVEVNKAKAFFNAYLGKALILDGVFDKDMFAAAVEFQNMFKDDVLDTWVEHFSFLDNDATGYIYQTTKWKINSIMCPGYEAFPDQLIVANGTTVAY